ncbi:PRC-barrel domain-containing protein [Pelagicoccus sp. SDUM812002]|uniref:PRC-barrel domain-containing protein n=1 Tax=Pelagicoccus sp. SDUM812002 TaxID=3041266 RepID=UPI0028119647|nr:PRC-barrel domain-containing protein [Pelagicoccus sp. SDUM812002]
MDYMMGLPLHCKGEESGSCDDLYFEDGAWKLRHVVAVDGGFVFKKRSLVSPESIDRVELAANQGVFPLLISKQVLDSAPEFESEVPFSRAVETAALKHYQLAPYWLSAPGRETTGIASGYPADDPLPKESMPQEMEPNLRSLKEVLGYEVRNGEKSLGRACDLILDLSDFSVAYLAVDTKPSESGGVRLVSTKQKDISLSVDYASKSFCTKCSSYHLQESPSADLSEGRLTLGDQQKVDLSSY